MSQISMFDGSKRLKIDKPIRLIELFAGYGSQALALKYLGVPFEHHRISEWAVNSIQAYKDLHFEEDNIDYSASLSKMEIVDYLDGRISVDYSTPMTREQILRKGEKWQRRVYSNMHACNNVGSITKVNAKDFGIKDTYLFTYLLTYSFPCQDLSIAGQRAGMKKGEGTRSGLLWEIERLLYEMDELPQILLMENVPAVIQQANMPDFAKWVESLEKLGYKSKWQVLNAKDFGIPQNRARCFMVSVLGDYYFDMPSGFPLKHRLKDFLDKTVDEKYYLSAETIISFTKHAERQAANGSGFGWKPTEGGGERIHSRHSTRNKSK